MILSKANGKLLLFGEYAALYGSPAIGVTLSQSIALRYEPSNSDDRVITIRGVGKEHYPILLNLCERLPIQLAGRLTITSNLPLGMGFGSSAALCVALARLVEQARPTEGDTTLNIWRLAHQLEHYFHGSPSGIDTGLSCHEGLLALYGHSSAQSAGQLAGTPVAPKKMARSQTPPWWILYGATSRNGKTKELIGKIVASVRQRDGRVCQLIANLKGVAERACELLLSNETKGINLERKIGCLIRQAHSILRLLTLSTKELEGIVELAEQHGSIGAKISGAGGGGAWYALFTDEYLLRQAAAAIGKYYPNTLIYHRPLAGNS